ncbi:hypothetical protein [Emcibacter nanhaiensis]|uniref:Uncharacterized protein n=1 Tax=Emcibacter nanhaiensis TaxID=1505037 RepID=A0A501PFX3_9PROT|nr:hypothetical protein [Emcibacter nanhaiensis]TPD59379.1 hypothetical protein FIV46_11335 [Emcibacter nanhaiensis]
MINFNDPFVMLGLLPLVLTIVSMALTRVYIGEGLGNTLASASLVVSFLLVMLIHFGWPDIPATDQQAKLFYLCLFALLYGVLLDRFPSLDKTSTFFKSVVPVAGVFWTFAPSGPFTFSEAEYRGLALITVLALGHFLKLEQDWQDGIDITWSLLLIAVGGMIIAWMTTADPVATHILLAFVSALAGYMILNLPKKRFPLGAAGLFPSFLIILSSLLNIIMKQPGLSPAIFLLSLIFLADGIGGLLPLQLSPQGKRLATMAGLFTLSLAAAYL